MHHLFRSDEGKCDIERAVSYGAGILTCESIRHATLISEVMLECIQEGAYEAEFAETKAHVILRLTSGNQFGMSLDDIEYIISHPDEFKGIAVMGIHYYSGTQKSLRKINKDLEKIKSALTGLKEKYGFEPQLVEYGPGLCVEYLRMTGRKRKNNHLMRQQRCLENLLWNIRLALRWDDSSQPHAVNITHR